MADPNSHANDGTPLRGFPQRPRPGGPDDGGEPQPESMGRLVDFIARINLSVREKLLGGFILVVLLLSAMAILSLVVISQMNQKVESLTELQERFDISRQMIYHITGQSHFRAMALLTDDPSWNVSIDRAKQTFSAQLAEVQRNSPPGREDFFAQMEEANARFTQSSADTLALHLKGDIDQALALHLTEEHPISHDVEDLLNHELGLRMGGSGGRI